MLSLDEDASFQRDDWERSIYEREDALDNSDEPFDSLIYDDETWCDE